MKNNSKMQLNRDILLQSELRSERKALLNAWDIFVANVAFGTKAITDERRAELLKWHNDILDLNESAIKNVPAEIVYYMGGNAL